MREKRNHTYFKKYNTKKIISYIEGLLPVDEYKDPFGCTTYTEFYMFIKDLENNCNKKELKILKLIMDGATIKQIVNEKDINQRIYYSTINKFVNFFNTGEF